MTVSGIATLVITETMLKAEENALDGRAADLLDVEACISQETAAFERSLTVVCCAHSPASTPPAPSMPEALARLTNRSMNSWKEPRTGNRRRPRWLAWARSNRRHNSVMFSIASNPGCSRQCAFGFSTEVSKTHAGPEKECEN